MANAKRASMREGPLAALFRKTEDPTAEDGAGPEPPAPRVDAAERRRRDHPARAGCRTRRWAPRTFSAAGGGAHSPRRASACATPSPRRYPRT